MKPGPFDLKVVRTTDEAITELAASEGEGKVLAGGQSLVPLMAFRLARPGVIVDINGVDELDFVSTEAGGVRFGALCRHHALETSDLVAERFPLISEAMPLIAHAPIRNRGTLGGSIAHADPGAELPTLAVTLEATLSLRGRRGTREVSASDFFVGPFMTCIADDELLTSVFVPNLPAGAGSAFLEIARRRGDFAALAVAAVLAVNDRSEISYARLGYASMGPTPLRATAAESLLVGRTANSDSFAAAATAAVSELRPVTDLHTSSDFRAHLAEVLTRRALLAALDRARPEMSRG